MAGYPQRLKSPLILQRHGAAEAAPSQTMLLPVTIRPATLNDVPALVDMERRAASAAHWAPEQYCKLAGDDSGTVLVADLMAEEAVAEETVAEETGKLCGFVCAKALVGEWELENVVVAAEFLRRGVASELMHGLMRRAQSEAGSMIRLEVRESNLAARALYLKHGFREAGRRGGYYQSPAEDAILYSRRLDG